MRREGQTAVNSGLGASSQLTAHSSALVSGVLSPQVFVDPEIYRLEQERLFAGSWLFVGHESEIPRPGDFVTRLMGETPVVVARGSDGVVRVLLNVCRHRGRRVCAEDAGRAAQFQCPYHGWTYSINGELIGVPFFEAYQGRLERSEFGLYQAPRVDSYQGLIFASWDPAAEPLTDWLGPITWVFDLLFGRTEAVEVVGPPMRWRVGANWKLGAANFAGDAQHVFTTHGFVTALGIPNPRQRAVGYVVPGERGHVANLQNWASYITVGQYLALPEDLWPEIHRTLAPEQAEVLRSLRVVAGTVFPNMSFLETASPHGDEWGGGEEFPAMSFLTVRVWQPMGADEMEMWSWFFVDRTAPEWWKRASRECYLREFGTGGIFEQDDVENWVQINRSLRGPVARRLRLQYGMGIEVGPPQEWPGPGRAYVNAPFGELSERLFFDGWQKMMGGSEPLPIRPGG